MWLTFENVNSSSLCFSADSPKSWSFAVKRRVTMFLCGQEMLKPSSHERNGFRSYVPSQKEVRQGEGWVIPVHVCSCLGIGVQPTHFRCPLQNIPAFFNSFPLLGSMCKCQFQSKKYQIFSFYIRMGWWNFLQFLCIETSVGHLTPHIHMHVYYSAVNESLLYVIYWEQEEHKFIQWRRICKASLPLSRWYVREASLFHHLQSKFSTHIYTTETRTKICYRQLDTIDAKILQKQQETLLVRQNIAFCSSDGAKITLGAFLDWLQDF